MQARATPGLRDVLSLLVEMRILMSTQMPGGLAPVWKRISPLITKSILFWVRVWISIVLIICTVMILRTTLMVKLLMGGKIIHMMMQMKLSISRNSSPPFQLV